MYGKEKIKKMRNTHFKVGDVFGDILCRESISPERITKLKGFSVKLMSKLVLV